MPKTVKPKVAVADGGSDYQPTVKVGRKTQGEIAALSPAEVTAGSKQDFTITYKATEALEVGDVIEVRLPKGWDSDLSNDSEADPPTPYQLDDDKPTDDGEVSYVYLGGSTSRLEGTKISVINDAGHDAFEADGDRDDGVTAAGGWFVRIVIGSKRVSKNGTIVLKYNDVTVQRRLTIDDPASVEVFSGPPVEGLPQLPPQFPVTEQKEVAVIHAADGSGMVTFEFDGDTIPALAADSKHNTAASIPAGIVKDDALDLTVTYQPDGDMGEGEFEIRLPSGWDAEDVQGAGVERSGRTVTVSFPHDRFGEGDDDPLEITLIDITVPNTHGNHGFLSKSKNAGGTLKQLSPRSVAFVGNADADNDTVKVKITPVTAYQNNDDVDFEITLTATGPDARQ